MTVPPQFPTEYGAYPEESQATTVLVLGIIGLFISILAPVAWIMGNRELAAIDAGRRAPDERSSANTGRILGIIGTCILIAGGLLLLLVLGLFITTSSVIS